MASLHTSVPVAGDYHGPEVKWSQPFSLHERLETHHLPSRATVFNWLKSAKSDNPVPNTSAEEHEPRPYMEGPSVTAPASHASFSTEWADNLYAHTYPVSVGGDRRRSLGGREQDGGRGSGLPQDY